MEGKWYEALTLAEQVFLLQRGLGREDINSQPDLWLVVGFLAPIYCRFSPGWYDLVRRLSETEVIEKGGRDL